ncbi:MAG: TIGR00730 family Rossman fold protein [Planctomycetota bacterium]
MEPTGNAQQDFDDESTPNEIDTTTLPPEAIGESVLERPQPADEPISTESFSDNSDLFEEMRQTIARLERDQTSRGDLKILSRTLKELRYAFKVYRPYRRRRKVTVFGSARTKPDHPDYQSAVELGRKMAEHGWMVITGAGGGIMEAGHVGAGKEASMGLNIMLPFEQGANPVIQGDHKLVTMKYFFTRKLMFVKECSAIVCCAGGFGTLDEALETLTLMQTGKQTMLPLVLLDHPGGSYWSDFAKFIDKQLLAGGMISPDDVSLYKVTNDVDEAVEEVLKFYRRYHSMRYVKNQLVFRLKESLSGSKLEQIQTDFADILVKGSFEQCRALEEESGEPSLAGLPRLVFHFNRRSLSRLRLLIDSINEG